MEESQNIGINSARSSMLCAFNGTGEHVNGKQATLNRMIICVSCLFALAGTASVTDYYIGNETTIPTIRRRLNGVD